MRQNPCYLRTTLSGQSYLLPCGQSVSEHKKALLLNETGDFLWQLLREETDLSALLGQAAEHFEIPDAQRADFQKEITDFLNSLILQGIVLEDPSAPDTREQLWQSIMIAGLRLNLFGPADIFEPSLADFSCPYTPQPDQTVLVLHGNPAVHENGSILIRGRELTVMELSDKYILLFPEKYSVRELHLLKDASLAIFYCIPRTETPREDLFHALRFAFLYLAQRHNILAVHSASVLYRDKAWLFSALSGTGKSTHAGLWHDLAQTPVLNGDLNLISWQEDRPVVYGLPWCGTSQIYTTASHELGGIIFLKQAPDDSIETLSPEHRVLKLSNRLISPSWDNRMLEKNLQICQKIAENIFMCRLHCTKDPSAQILLQKAIDRSLLPSAHDKR